jgi:hypothetical protein
MCLFLLRDSFIYILLNAWVLWGGGVEKTLGGNREIFLDLLDMRWEIYRLNIRFRMMSGVEIRP